MWWIVASAALNVSPVYLDCQFAQPSGPWPVQIAVDEANQRLTIGRPNVAPKTIDALFTPSEIVAAEPVGSESMTWTISRTDLSVKTTTSFSTNVTLGACKLSKLPAKRAF